MMHNNNQQLKKRVRIIGLYGDADIILSIYRSKFWQYLLSGNKLAWWVLNKGFFNMGIEMCVFPVRMLLRYRHGNRTAGWIILALSLSTLIAYNSVHLYPLFANTIAWFVWFIPLFSETLSYKSLVLEVHSPPLFYFTCAFTIWGCLQVFSIYFLKKFNNKDKSKRGESIIFFAVRRLLPNSESFVQAFMEPLLILILALWFRFYGGDVYAFLYFGIVSICLFTQEILDILRQKTLPRLGSYE